MGRSVRPPYQITAASGSIRELERPKEPGTPRTRPASLRPMGREQWPEVDVVLDDLGVALRIKRINLELRKSREMLGIAGEQGEVMLQRRRGDQRICESQPVCKRMRIDEHHGPFRDRRIKRNNLCFLNSEPALNTLQFVPTATALGEFQVRNRRNTPWAVSAQDAFSLQRDRG